MAKCSLHDKWAPLKVPRLIVEESILSLLYFNYEVSVRYQLSTLLLASFILSSCNGNGGSAVNPEMSSNGTSSNGTSSSGTSVVVVSSSSATDTSGLSGLWFSDSVSTDTSKYSFITYPVHIVNKISTDSIYRFSTKVSYDSIQQSSDPVALLLANGSVMRAAFTVGLSQYDLIGGEAKFDPSEAIYSPIATSFKFYFKQVGLRYYYVDVTNKRMYTMRRI